MSKHVLQVNSNNLQCKVRSLALASLHVMVHKYVEKKCLLHELYMLLKILDISFAKKDPVRHPPVRWIKKLAHKLHLLHKLTAGGDCHRIICKTQCLLQLCPIDKGECGSSSEKTQSSGESDSFWSSTKNGLWSRTTITNYREKISGPKPRGQEGAEWSHSIIMSHNEICMCQGGRP